MTQPQPKSLSRRQFVRRSALLTAGLAIPQFIPRHVLGSAENPGANERITVGVIGVGGRANLLIDQTPAQGQIVSVADCFVKRCEEGAAKRKAKWRIHQDYRKLLDEKDIDAVIVGTHDHGRVLPCIHAC